MGANVRKYLSSAALAIVVTFGLFMMMQLLIATTDGLEEVESFRIADVLMPDVKPEIMASDETPERPDTPDTPPPPVQMDFQPNDVEMSGIQFKPNVKVDASGGGLFRDGEYQPIFKVPPSYPRRAAERGIEGYVILLFTVTATGTVENAVVVESVPPTKIFHAAAIRAALRFKYKPKVIDGKAVSVDKVPHRITFKLGEEKRRGR